MDDSSYRIMLARLANGKTSSVDLTEVELRRVLDEMRQKGFVPKTKKNVGKRPNPPQNKEKLMSKVEALLTDAGRAWSYADGMAQKMFHGEKVDWLDGSQLWSLVAALEKDARRHGRGSWPPKK